MRTWQKIAAIGIVLAMLPVFFVGNTYLQRTFTIALFFVLFTIGLNVLFGHTDQLFLFTGGLAGTSAYTTTLLAREFGITPWMTVPAGVLLAGLTGLVVSYIAAKRKFTVIVIAIFTLALQLAFMQFISGSRDITGGTTGLPVPDISVDPLVFYYGTVGVVVLYLLFYDRLLRSRFGMSFSAIREDELAAETTGIDTVWVKTLTGFIGAAMIGLTGALLTLFEGYITPSLFTFQAVDTLVLIMLVLGGMRTLEGPVVGGILVFWINERLSGAGGLRLVIFGAAIIVLFLYFQQGIVPWLKSVADDYDVLDRSTWRQRVK